MENEFTYWFISTESKEIEVKKASRNTRNEDIYSLWKKLIDCRYLETFYFQKDENTEYCLIMDEEGFTKEKNTCAMETIVDINLNWTRPLRGNFIVCVYSIDEEGNETYKDMDITLPEFIQLCNKILSKS